MKYAQVTVTMAAHDALVRHGAKRGSPNDDDTVNIMLGQDVVAALQKFAPDTDDEIHDISEAIIRVCSGMFGSA